MFLQPTVKLNYNIKFQPFHCLKNCDLNLTFGYEQRPWLEMEKPIFNQKTLFIFFSCSVVSLSAASTKLRKFLNRFKVPLNISYTCKFWFNRTLILIKITKVWCNPLHVLYKPLKHQYKIEILSQKMYSK